MPTLSFCDSAGSWRYSVLTGSILVGCPGQVTVACDDSTQVVARSGHLSIFAALEECCPGCVRNESPTGRRGLTRIEFNKALERQEGFEKMRDRRADAATCEEDPTGGDAPTVCARSHCSGRSRPPLRPVPPQSARDVRRGEEPSLRETFLWRCVCVEVLLMRC